MGQSERTDTLVHSKVGQHWTSNTSAVTGNFGVIEIWEDGTTFSNLTLPAANDATIPEGITYNKGDRIFGLCTGYTLSAGTVCAHKIKSS